MRIVDGRRATKRVAAAGMIAVIAYAVLAGLQILVLNPRYAVPGKDLAAIGRDLDAAGESMQPGYTFAVLGLGVALALLTFVVLTRRSDATARAALVAYLVMLVFGAPAYFVASFAPGMALADTYMISGADYSPWSVPLYAVSGLAIVALVGVVVVGMTRRGTADTPA